MYPQNQQTYVVCLDSPQNLSVIMEIDPLEQLLQSSIKHKKTTRQPRFLRGEILIEWKKKYQKKSMGMYVEQDICILIFIFHKHAINRM
jgi:hypothetical protein